MSTSPTLPLFGRVWSLQVLSPVGNGDQETLLNVSTSTGVDDTNALRITFDVHMTAGKALWEATIRIYNLEPTTIGMISQGDEVSLSIGYESQGQPSEIFRGFVFQPTFEREDVVDFVLTLHCMVGLPELVLKIVNLTTGPVANQWQIVQKIAQAAGINIAHIDDPSSFNQQQLPRGKTIFGTANNLFAQISAQSKLISFYSAQGLNIGKPTGTSATPDLIYAPPLGYGQQPSSDEASITRSLIGSPQQTQDGVLFRVLGDPRLQIKLPLMQVKIDQAVIRQMPFTFGSTPKLNSLINQDGVYYVVLVRHIGDSRGNEWYSEVIGITSVNNLASLVGSGNSLL